MRDELSPRVTELLTARGCSWVAGRVLDSRVYGDTLPVSKVREVVAPPSLVGTPTSFLG